MTGINAHRSHRRIINSSLGQGWRHLFEPDMECAQGGECRQPGRGRVGNCAGDEGPPQNRNSQPLTNDLLSRLALTFFIH